MTSSSVATGDRARTNSSGSSNRRRQQVPLDILPRVVTLRLLALLMQQKIISSAPLTEDPVIRQLRKVGSTVAAGPHCWVKAWSHTAVVGIFVSPQPAAGRLT
jgi:hypothetical protein